MNIQMKVVETTYEIVGNDGFIYRIFQKEDGKCFIKRVPVNSPLWSHGVISQIYLEDEGIFEIMIRAARGAIAKTWVPNLETAMAVVLKTQGH